MAERGGTTEQHQKAGHAGGVATASSHGRESHQEIEKQGGENRSGRSTEEDTRNTASPRGGTSEQHAMAGRKSHKDT